MLFDFDTRDVNDQKSLDTLCEFIRAIGQAVGKPVAVTHEGSRLLLLQYHPGTDEFASGDDAESI